MYFLISKASYATAIGPSTDPVPLSRHIWVENTIKRCTYLWFEPHTQTYEDKFIAHAHVVLQTHTHQTTHALNDNTTKDGSILQIFISYTYTIIDERKGSPIRFVIVLLFITSLSISF
jgi:hypothetical protein